MKTSIEILNLKCGGCANSIRKGLLALNADLDVEVDLEKSLVTINTDEQVIVKSVKEKLSNMGYPAQDESNTILHKAKSFVSCASGRMNKEV
jgi:copper chaperone CopZ